MARELAGACPCGRVRFRFSTTQDDDALWPRACDCEFCTSHDAVWVSDPDGALAVEALATDLETVRQGSEQASFVRCAHCHSLVLVAYVDGGDAWAAVNAKRLDASTGLAPPTAASPRLLSPAQKMQRWRALWIPDVRLPGMDPASDG